MRRPFTNEGPISTMLRFLLVPALFLGTSVANAAPSVFVKSEPNGMWWNGEITARVIGKSSGSTTVEKLNAYIDETIAYYSYSVCSLDSVSSETFVGMDRQTQAEIDMYKPYTWEVTSIAPDGRKIRGQIVVYEGCETADPRGAALLVTDADTGQILRWQTFGYYDSEKDAYQPIWVVFIKPREDSSDELFSTSICLECGDATYHYYDISRKHVYFEHNGH